jgi:spermidine synthase
MSNFLNLLVYIFVFLTGVSALVYQVVWQRMLTRLLGAETLATSIVLAVFLVGLSLGYFLSGWWSTRLKNAMKGYALLEAITGIWGFAFMLLYAGVSGLTLNWAFEPPFWMISQGLFCTVLLLLIPTVCMGGTVPLLTRALSKSVSKATRQHAWIYSLNTAGAFLGTLLTGFFLVELYGISMSIKLAAGINIASALVFFLVGKYAQETGGLIGNTKEDSQADPEPTPTPSVYLPRTLYAVAFFNGCSILCLENVFLRITNVAFASTAYSFTIIVAVFILSLAIGGYLVAARKQFSPKTLYRNQILVTSTFILLFFTIDKWPYLAHLIRLPFNQNIVGFVGFQGLAFITLLVIVVVPLSIAGMTLPLIFHELKRTIDQVGFHSGAILFVNGLGSLLGSLLGGFILFYWLQLGDVFLFAVLVAGINLLLTAWTFDFREKVTAGALATIVVIVTFTQPFYDDRNLVIGHFRIRDVLPSSLQGPGTFYAETIPQHGKILTYNTGPALTSAVVSKTNDQGRESLGLYSNGRNESRIGGGRGDELTTKLLAHLPLLLSQDRKKVFVIGLGTGSTAGEAVLYPDVDNITVAEIAPGIWDALPHFDRYINNLSKDPRLNAESGDAMRILKRRPEQWNVIVSEPSNPYIYCRA